MPKRALDPSVTVSYKETLREAQHRLLRLGARCPPSVDSRVYAARPWYHDFSGLGVGTEFSQHMSTGEVLLGAVRRAIGKRPLGAQVNQRVKDEQILPFIEQAFTIHQTRSGPVESFLDLFAADGYYSFWVSMMLGVRRATAIELRTDYIAQGRLMAEVLGISTVEFLQQNVYDMSDTPVDVALCAGGLYHVNDPEALLSKLTRANVLVTQSIVTTHTSDPAYFETPAPGWPHGCRFTHSGFEGMLVRSGWDIVTGRLDIVDGPANEYSAGSSTYLCTRREP